jgi:AraC-like DNA-binding protein
LVKLEQNQVDTMVAELEKILYDDSGGFRAAYIKDTSGFWHFHPEYELVLNIKSNGSRIIGDSVELFDQYDMVLIAANIPHAWNYYTSDNVLPEKHGIIFHFKLSSFGENLLSQHEMHDFRELMSGAKRGLSFPQDDAKKAEKYLIQMINSKGIEKMVDLFNLIRVLVSSEKRCFICSENYKMDYDERGNKRMANVYTFLRENYSKQISLDDISKIAKMNPVAFSRYFKEYSGTGFVEYLNRLRTNKACYLLRETEYHVNQIASECGFESISNFNKQFRKSEGISPRDYRSQFR